ncbi:hypothetical protein [Silvimonas iriomotensis]|uniref:RNA-binding protein n=1 Tax=Silvimonas iriomotensis TaxID=449662 RepID=A0ABQ2PDR7_9NEIS|nr:hypothetical protein [Silvimonas iriomotensis]GGP23531.1 hypothetical protein GCM10010970_35310 [Silvimonas iriomotensis]
MAQILIGNLPPDVSLDDLRTMLIELGVPKLGEITMAEGAERTAALVTIDLPDVDVGAISRQLEGHLWRERQLRCAHSTLGWGN